MEKQHSTHIVSYKTYIYILVTLLALTFASISITSIELGPITVLGALLFASIKTILVLLYFMHLKFDRPFIRIMVFLIFILLGVVIFITFLDYLYR